MVTRQNGMTTAEPKAQTPEVQNEDAVKASSNLKDLKGIEAQTPVPQNEGAMKASSGLEDMDCSMKREWSDMPMNAGSKELWQWWCDNLEADAANTAACALYEPDVAPLGAELAQARISRNLVRNLRVRGARRNFIEICGPKQNLWTHISHLNHSPPRSL
jgi:hypothetical protein